MEGAKGGEMDRYQHRGFERDQGKFPSWYSSVKNTEASLFSQGLSLQALKKCYSVCWQGALFGMGVVKMDIDKNNKKKSISAGFLYLHICCCL